MTEEMLGGLHRSDAATWVRAQGWIRKRQRSMLLESSAWVCPNEANTPEKSSCNGRPR